MRLILTCEHAGNGVPKEYRHLFTGARKILDSHRGYDPGALDLFKELRKIAFFDKFHTVSRLLVEPNRSLHHPQLFSEFSRDLTEPEKAKLLEKFYFPYRDSVEEEIRETISGEEEVLHLSVHTFTPVLAGQVRNADIGLLYDPKRAGEKEFCTAFKKAIGDQDPDLQVRFNYPYRGTADGFTTFLRIKFRQNYCGIEIEVNQKFTKRNLMNNRIKNTIFKALSEVLPCSKSSEE